MSETHTSAGGHQGAEMYEIRLRGYLDARRAEWFDGLTVTHESEGITLLRGPVLDEAALFGLIQRVRDLGMPLISVQHIEPGPAPTG